MEPAKLSRIVSGLQLITVSSASVLGGAGRSYTFSEFAFDEVPHVAITGVPVTLSTTLAQTLDNRGWRGPPRPVSLGAH